MARSYKHGQEKGAEGGKEGNAVGMLAEHALGYLDEPVHTARGLKHTGAGHGGYDDVNHIGGWRTGFHVETEHQNGQTDTGDGTKSQTAVARAYPKGNEHNKELNNHNWGHRFKKVFKL